MAAKITNRQKTIEEYFSALKQLVEYRGITKDHYDFSRIHKSTQTKVIEMYTKDVLDLLNKPLERATDKQVALIKKLTSKERFPEGYEVERMNKFQASEFITLLLEGENLVYNRYSKYEDFVEQEQDEDKAIKIYAEHQL